VRLIESAEETAQARSREERREETESFLLRASIATSRLRGVFGARSSADFAPEKIFRARKKTLTINSPSFTFLS